MRRFEESLAQKDTDDIFAEYLHFGDIDAGGFEIHRDLCARTKIPFSRFYMDLQTLKKYAGFGKPLTENDRVRLQKMLQTEDSNEQSADRELAEVVQYMLAHNLKLEQECIVS